MKLAPRRTTKNLTGENPTTKQCGLKGPAKLFVNRAANENAAEEVGGKPWGCHPSLMAMSPPWANPKLTGWPGRQGKPINQALPPGSGRELPVMENVVC